jgi:tetratricopeptide (TPR) repeat protein
VALNQLAGYLEHSGDVREAERVYDSASAVMDSIGYSETLSAVAILSNSYNTSIKVGNIVASLEKTREAARRLDLANPGSPHPVVSFQRGQALFNAGMNDSSAIWFQRMIAASNQSGLRDFSRRGWIGLSRAASRAGDLPLARRALDSALALNRELKRPGSRDSLFLVGSIDLARGEGARALAAFQGALALDGFGAGKRNEGMRPVLLDGAQAALLAGQPDTALSMALAGEEIAAVDSQARRESGFVGEARLRQAQALKALGRTAEAKARVSEALTALNAGAGANHPRTREAIALEKALVTP